MSLATNVRIVLSLNDSDVEVKVLWKTDQCIHCDVRSKNGSFKGHGSFIYARNSKEERQQLWNTLVAYQMHISIPWLLIGDYNVILNLAERIHESGNIKDLGEELEIFFEQIGLTDLHQEEIFSRGGMAMLVVNWTVLWLMGFGYNKLKRVMHTFLLKVF